MSDIDDFFSRRAVYRVRHAVGVGGVELEEGSRIVYFEWLHSPHDEESTYVFARAPRADGPEWRREDPRLHYLQPPESERLSLVLTEDDALPRWRDHLEPVALTAFEKRVLERQA